jgi:hypothetical protein
MTVREVPFQISISLHTPEQGLTQERENEVDKTRWITQQTQRSKTLAPTDWKTSGCDTLRGENGCPHKSWASQNRWA